MDFRGFQTDSMHPSPSRSHLTALFTFDFHLLYRAGEGRPFWKGTIENVIGHRKAVVRLLVQ